MTSQCPNKENCGSCGWSHIPYSSQLDQKLSEINASFQLKQLSYVCKDILPSPKTSHYRNRMDFVIDYQGRVGLREKGKWWKVIDNHCCFISDERIEEAFGIVREWVKQSQLSFFDRKAHTGLLRYVVIRTTATKQLMINIVTSAPADESENDRVKDKIFLLNDAARPTTLVWSVNNTVTDVSHGGDIRLLSGEGYIQESLNGITYKISPNAFFQTNSLGAKLLLDTVCDFISNPEGGRLLDLYCGTGFFAIALAKKFRNVFGVELVPEAIADARVNAAANKVDVEFFSAKTEEFDWIKFGAETIIVDPPRSGMHDKALQDLIQAKPKQIIYVSCNFKNFAREMVELSKYYSLDKMRAIDMFPHTPHVELVSCLQLK